MNKLFPLRTFQQDAILKRLNEIVEALEENIGGFEGQLLVELNVITIPEKDGLYQLVNASEKVIGVVDIITVNATVGVYSYCGFYDKYCFAGQTPAVGQAITTIDLSVGWYEKLPSHIGQGGKYLKVRSDTGSLEWADVSAGTTVVANPTLEGTESNLTGLQVDSNKYKVPNGCHVYNIVYGSSQSFFRYVTDNDNITDEATLRADLLAKGCTSSKKYPITGPVCSSGGESYQLYSFVQMYVNSQGTTLYVERYKYTYTINSSTNAIECSIATETKNNLSVTVNKVF